MRRSRDLASIARSLQGATMVLFVAVLYLARDVLIPLALGVLVAFLLSPIVARLQRAGISDAVAVLATTALVLLCFVGFVFAIGSSVSGFADDLPRYRDELKKKIASCQTMVSSWMPMVNEIAAGGDTANAVSEQLQETSQRSVEDNGNAPTKKLHDGSSAARPLYVTESDRGRLDVKSWAGGAAALLGPIGTAGLVAVFAIFALIYREDLSDRVVSVISQGNYVVTADAFSEASDRIGKYLLAQLVLNTAYGCIFAGGLMVIGYFLSPDGWFPYFAVLGLVAGLARFVPYVGPLVGASLPLMLSIVVFPGFQVVTAVGILVIVLELVSNNVVEPCVYGSSTGVSPVAVIIAAVFWGWLWGPIGLLLATPLTVCVVVLGQYVPRFKFLSTLLSDKVQVPASVRGYQRLLVGDQRKVNDFVKNEAKDVSVAGLLDDTLIPTLKVVLRDTNPRSLSDAQLFENLRTALVEGGVIASDERSAMPEGEHRNSKPAASGGQSGKRCSVVAIPVRNLGEQMIVEAVRDSMDAQADFTVWERSDLPDRDAELVAEQNPEVVVIAVVPPGGIDQSRYWCSELRKAAYRGQIIIACFGKFKNYDSLFVSLRRHGANLVVTTASQLIQKLLRATSGLSTGIAARRRQSKQLVESVQDSAVSGHL